MDNFKLNKAIFGGSWIAANKMTAASGIALKAALVGTSGIQHLIDSKVNLPFANQYSFVTGLGLENLTKLNNSIGRYEKLVANSFVSSNIQSLINYQETINKSFKPIDSIINSTRYLENYNRINKELVPSYIKAITGILPSIEKQVNIQKNLNKLLHLSTDNLLNETIQKDDSDRIEQVEDDLIAVIELTKAINSNQTITHEHVQNINSILSKQGITSFIYFVIGILVTVLFQNTELKELKSEVIELNTEVKGLKIESEAQNEFSKTLNILCLEERVAIRNVYIRAKPSSKSTSLGILKAGSPTFVQQINHKWLYIIYQDENYIMKTGWVYKKHLKRIK